METKKQEAIRLAYGDKYESAKNILDENGWCNYQLNDERELIRGISPREMECEYNNFKQDNVNLKYFWRPKSLSGIETNNGWISILSEDDLPKYENAKYHGGKFLNNGDWIELEYRMDLTQTINHFKHGVISHFQQSKDLTPPIF